MTYRLPTVLICLFLAASAPGATTALDPITIGDSEERVCEVLGQPRGWMKSLAITVLLYERGRVELIDDKVTRIELVSKEEADARRIAREAEAQQLAARQIAERAQRIEEGTALKARMLEDVRLQDASAGTQVGAWESFQRRFPEVSVATELAEARSLKQAEDERYQLEARLAAMERLAASAERRADAAEKKAEEASERARDRQRTYVYYTTPLYDICSTGVLLGRPPYRNPVYAHPQEAHRSYRYIDRPGRTGGVFGEPLNNRPSSESSRETQRAFRYSELPGRTPSVGIGYRLHSYTTASGSGISIRYGHPNDSRIHLGSTSLSQIATCP